jgi:hypothetical protein
MKLKDNITNGSDIFFRILIRILILAGLFFGAQTSYAEQSQEEMRVKFIEMMKKSMQNPEVRKQVGGTIIMKLAFQFRRIQKHCKDDIYIFCKDKQDMQQPGCILQNREHVSNKCERLLAQEFGGKPTKYGFAHLGFTFPPGSITFKSIHDNSIIQIITKAPSFFKGAAFKPGPFMFNGGAIRPTEFDKPITIDGVTYKPPYIGLTIEGHIRAGTPIHDAHFDGITFKGGEPVEFYKGQIISGVILNNIVIDGKTYEALTHISFHYFTKPLAVSVSTPYKEWKNRPNIRQLMEEYLKQRGK